MDPAENPAVPLSAIAEGDGFFDMLAGPPSVAGTRVSRHRALGLSAVWRGVNLIAGDIGRHPFRVYEHTGPGFRVDKNHQSARVMRRPNDYMTSFTFRQTLQAHALLSGNGYAFISRTTDAVPLELLPLSPDHTWPVRVDGELWYVTQIDNRFPADGSRTKRKGTFVKIKSSDMIHIRGLGFDGLVGYPVLRIMRDTLGMAIAGRDYGARYFKNNGSPGVVLQVPPGMKDPAINNLRESWSEMHVGIDKAHRPAILRDGVTLGQYTGSTARDAQLLENRQYDVREIANVLGVPPHKLGDTSTAAYNSLESENQSYDEDTLDRWFITWEQESDMKLLTEQEKEFETHSFKFDALKLQSVPLADRGTYYSKAIQAGWLNRDEVRGFENMNPIPDGKGQEFLKPSNTTPSGAAAPQQTLDQDLKGDLNGQ